jgi:4-hydroxybenzoate polyprenyltransferase
MSSSKKQSNSVQVTYICQIKYALLVPFFRLLRWPNLLIVALTQYLLQYRLIAQEPLDALPAVEFALLVLTTVLITASGNVVNDIVDCEVDKLNKPLHKQIVGRIWTKSESWVIYAVLVVLGFLISLYLAIYIQNFGQILIYPLAVGLLWLYSKYLKSSVLWGNLLVSAFCAFVAWIVWYAQSLYAQTNVKIDAIFLGYAVFAFISNMLREIVKDIEDAQGDAAMNCRTLPVVFGLAKAKQMGLGVGFLFGGLLLSLHFFEAAYPYKVWFLDVFVLLPLILILLRLNKATEKEDFNWLSQATKWLMLAGVLALFF